MSVEQRNFFEKQRSKLYNSNPEFFSMEDVDKMPIWRFMHWPTFRKADNHQIGTHPLSLAWKSLDENRRVHENRIGELSLALSCNVISTSVHDIFVEELTQELDRIESQFCVKRRKDYLQRHGVEKLDKPLGQDRVYERVARRISECTSVGAGSDSSAVHAEEQR